MVIDTPHDSTRRLNQSSTTAQIDEAACYRDVREDGWWYVRVLQTGQEEALSRQKGLGRSSLVQDTTAKQNATGARSNKIAASRT